MRPVPAGLGPLGARLAATLVGVAMLSLAIFAGATLWAERADVAHLAAYQRQVARAAVGAALASSYRPMHSWAGADLTPAIAAAQRANASLALFDLRGHRLLSTAGPGRPPVLEAGQVIAGGHVVGRFTLGFQSGGAAPADHHLIHSMERAVAVSGALAVLAAVGISLVAARAVVAPLRRVTEAARAIERGERGEVLDGQPGPGELGELAEAFKAMAASIQRNEQLRRTMMADVAHELRTPLAILQAETEALVDGVAPPTPAALASLHDETLRVGRMVEDLQTLAVAEAAGLRMERTRLDLAGLVQEVTDAAAPRFEAAGLSLQRHLSPAIAWGDSQRLRQVVENLLSNALKFTPAPGIVRVEVEGVGQNVRLAVADSGAGIAASERESVFNRFYRGSQGKKVQGSGIGLAVVKELVEAHSGRIRITDGPLGGACFEIEIPSAAEAEAPPVLRRP